MKHSAAHPRFPAGHAVARLRPLPGRLDPAVLEAIADADAVVDASEAGRSVHWVASQLGHANPAVTLRAYAHAMPLEGGDLSFADFRGPRRPETARGDFEPASNDNAPGRGGRGRFVFLERETGFEPATLTLAT